MKINQALLTVNDLLANKALWEDLQVVAFDLNDAREDLNDSLKRAEISLIGHKPCF